MHAADIKASLEKAGTSCAQVAKALKVPPSTVHQVIYGRGVSRRVAAHISRTIGVPVSKLWPGRYPRLELAELRAAA
ncbi:helix-turn-helix domain-containing protein [Polycyclovorans algicola]|uniref:helix-turn-helix domain-containing protein n=1 Tax=Polycyclovorans algicola TaxID=616992 RepID=UPI000A065180